MNGFEEAYSLLPQKHFIEVRDEIMECCDWSLAKFHRVKSGKWGITPVEREFIKKVFRKYNIDVETGKLINKQIGILIPQ